MCFNKEVSIASWVFALIIAVYLYNRNRRYDRWNAYFLFTFTLIQLIEGGIWLSIERGNFQMNTFLTTMIPLVLLLQPLVQSASGYTFTKNKVLYALSVVYLIIFVYYAMWLATPRTSRVGPSGHLVWGKKKVFGLNFIGIMYLMGLFIPLLFMKGGLGIPLIAIGGVTAIYSIYKTKKTGEFGSLWCWTSVIYGIAALML